jgi:hypothetical protein
MPQVRSLQSRAVSEHNNRNKTETSGCCLGGYGVRNVMGREGGGGGGHMCSCRSFVSSVLLFLCFANMQPTLTAFSMNSLARVCRGE